MPKHNDRLLFNLIGYTLISLVTLICVIPIILVLTGSVTSERAIHLYGYSIWPAEFSFEAYKLVFKVPEAMLRAYGVTITITVIGTLLGLFLTSMAAYALQRKYFKYRNLFALFIYFTTLFNGGLVPTYILIVRYLNLKNTLLALIIPSLIGVFNIIIMRGFMTSIPESLGESAKIDGANEFTIFRKIYLPLSKPALATIGLFIALGYWNNWANAMLYITDEKLYPLQYFLYNMLNSMQAASEMAAASGILLSNPPTESFKLAMTVIATGPIVLLYPFVQRYFVAGLTIGAVKG